VIGKRVKIANRFASRIWEKYHRNHLIGFETLEEIEENLPPVGAYRKTKVFCSCPYCCGNPRRGKGSLKDRLTKQELQALEDEVIQFQEGIGVF